MLITIQIRLRTSPVCQRCSVRRPSASSSRLAAYGIVDNAKQAADIAMKLGNIELSRRILDLEQEVTELTHENWELKNAKKELEQKLQLKAKMTFKSSFWSMGSDSIPFCPKCYEGDQKLAHLRLIPGDESLSSYSFCYVCNNSLLSR